MRSCPWCRREVPDGADTCPHGDCGRLLDVEMALKDSIPAPPPPPGTRRATPPPLPSAEPSISPPLARVNSERAAYSGTIPLPPPPATAGPTIDEPIAAPPVVMVPGPLAMPSSPDGAGRRRSLLLAAAAAAVMLLAAVCWGGYYATHVINREGVHPVVSAAATPAMPVERTQMAERAQTATLSGQIVNAINNHPVPNAELRISGTPLIARSDQDGRYRLEGVSAGKTPVRVSAAGFTSEQFEQVVRAGKENPLRVALSPGMKAGQIRIVLTWGDDPKDLDAHLEGPLPGGGKFHVYYGNQGDLKSKEFVHLDVDARNGQGPETITVLGVLPGVYHYWVHDYSDRDDPKSTALANSEAEVKVFQGDHTYRFRAGHEMVGNRWDACTIEVPQQGLAARVKKVDTYQETKLASLGLYAKRTLPGREQWIAQSGGSSHSEKTVDEGLAWLARHQDLNGSWSNQCLGEGAASRCEKPTNCTGEGSIHCPMAHTGLAVLAFQAGGHYYFNHNVYSEVVRRGLDWLAENGEPDGALFDAASESGARLRLPPASRPKNKANARAQRAPAVFSTGRRFTNASMYEQGMAAFALADACATVRESGQEPDHRYLDATTRAVHFIEKVQHNDGGWRYNDQANAPSDTSVTGWQVLALKSAREAGIAVAEPCVESVRRYFEARKMPDQGRTWYLNHPGTDAMTGVGMLARQFLLDAPNDPLIPEAARYLAGEATRRWGDLSATTGDRDYYLWYNCTLGMYQAGGPPWDQWNPIIRDTIIKLQRHDGCARGSWDPTCNWGPQGGRILSTALAALTLETYYRYTAPQERGAAPATGLKTGPQAELQSLPQINMVPLSPAASPAAKPVGVEARVKPVTPALEPQHRQRDK